jgi:hypothetical protein
MTPAKLEPPVVECSCRCHEMYSGVSHPFLCCQGQCPICLKWFKSGLAEHVAECRSKTGRQLTPEDWWADPVKDIYRDALAALGGDDGPLMEGPGHIAWADGNFADKDIRFCLREAKSRRLEWLNRYGENGLKIANLALKRLLLVPQEVRDCDPYYR